MADDIARTEIRCKFVKGNGRIGDVNHNTGTNAIRNFNGLFKEIRAIPAERIFLTVLFSVQQGYDHTS